MISKYNPNINDYYVDIEQGQDANLNEYNFRVAFSVEDYLAPRRLKNDEKYVRWVFKRFGKKDNVYFEREVPYHKCTETDYNEFYKIEQSQELRLSEIKSDPTRDFYCIDWDEEDPYVIYGLEGEANYQRLEMLLLPCNVVMSEIETSPKWEVKENCEGSLEEQIKYVGQSQVLMLVNKERFMPQKYGDQTISRYSTILGTQFDETKPSWAALEFVQTEMQDESTLLQLGYDEQTDLFSLNRVLPSISSWNVHPSTSALGRYKFISVEVNMFQQILVINRETYDLLSWLGDVGGLTDAFLLICSFILAPFKKFNTSSFILQFLFRYLPSAVHSTDPSS